MTNVLEALQATQNARLDGTLSSPMSSFNRPDVKLVTGGSILGEILTGTSDEAPITFRDTLAESISQNHKIPKPTLEAFAMFESLSKPEQQHLTTAVNQSITQSPEPPHTQAMQGFTELVRRYYASVSENIPID